MKVPRAKFLPPPPPNFTAATGVSWAETCRRPGYIKFDKPKGSRAAGIRYERKVHSQLKIVYGDAYFEGQWFHWLRDGKQRYCQADGFVLSPGGAHCVIFEAKLKHTSNAWWQLRHLYEPVIRKTFSRIETVSLVEICHHYDPDVRFGEDFELIDGLAGLEVPGVYVIAFDPRIGGI